MSNRPQLSVGNKVRPQARLLPSPRHFLKCRGLISYLTTTGSINFQPAGGGAEGKALQKPPLNV